MTKKAKILAALTQKAPLLLFTGKTITVASVKAAAYKTHKCVACTTEVAFGSQVGDGMTPFCPSCGETMDMMPAAQNVVPVIPQEEMLTSIGCPHCASNNVIEDRTMAALAGDIHCAACGNNVQYKTVAVTDTADAEGVEVEDLDSSEEGEGPTVAEKNGEEQSSEGQTMAALEASDGPISGAGGEANLSGKTDQKPDTGVSAEMPMPTGDTTDAPMTGVDAEQQASLESDAADHVANGAAAAAEAAAKAAKQGEAHKDELEEKMAVGAKGPESNPDITTGEDEVTATDNDGDDDMDGEEEDDDDFTELDMSDLADDDGDVEVKMDDDAEEARILAFVNGVHTMTLAKADAGENQDVFATANFAKALGREATKSGFKALAAYGFKGVKINVPLKKVVEQRVQAALAKEKAQVTASMEDLRANYDQCAKIAVTALTQNFYRNKRNPVQDQLIATLQGMGFTQAKKVVNVALLQAGPQLVTAMLELATELMGKSVTARNELSDSLTQMNPEFANPFNDPEDDDTVDEVDNDDVSTTPEQLVARLQGSGISIDPARREQKVPETASLAGNVTQMGARLRQLKNL